MSSEESFGIDMDGLRQKYQEWHEEFQEAKKEFDDRLDKIHEKYEDYFMVVAEALVTSAYEVFPEFAEVIHTCEPYPEQEDFVSLAIFEEDGKMLGTTEVSIEDVHSLALRYLSEENDDAEEVEDSDEYFFEEHP